MAQRPQRLEITENRNIRDGEKTSWSLSVTPPEGGPPRTLEPPTDIDHPRQSLVRRAQRLAMEQRSIILVFDVTRTIIEAYESIDCRTAVEDGMQARGILTEHGNLRHVVVPLAPDSIRLC